MSEPIFRNEHLHIVRHESEIPWVKIFTNEPYKELFECTLGVKEAIFTAIDVVERTMIEYYKPEKINIASFGNYLPHLHFHVMARFKEDSYFPEPMWGVRQREGVLSLPPFDGFLERLQERLKS